MDVSVVRDRIREDVAQLEYLEWQILPPGLVASALDFLALSAARAKFIAHEIANARL